MKSVLADVLKSIADNAAKSAFFIDGQTYSYAQLRTIVNSIREVVSLLPLDEKTIGLVLRDDIETYASIIALWLEGKAYVPLHSLHPFDRNKEIICQIGLTTIIDSSENTLYGEYQVINPNRIENRGDIDMPIKDVNDTDLAYVLFTSGSTGIPKGVCITRGNLAAFMDSFWKTGISITPEDRCLQCFDLSFDVSIQSFLVALTRGACVYTVPYGQVKYLYVASLIQEQRITFGAMAPSMLAYLRPYFEEFDASSLKTCILTAEACPVDLLEDWFKCAVNAELYDFYGPTEATVYCTCYKLHREGQNLSVNGVISIGKPLANVQAFILDETGRVLHAKEKGELCISGEHLTPGYWSDTEKNAASFFTRMIDGVSYRLYHTGDLCFWDETGNIMYIGRLDQQAKIQGFRVELSEIEYHAREFFNKEKRVMAIAFNGEKGLSEIALFVESESESPDGLLAFLRTKMPNYMIPSRVLYYPVFPLNSSDKVDRNKMKQSLS